MLSKAAGAMSIPVVFTNESAATRNKSPVVAFSAAIE